MTDMNDKQKLEYYRFLRDDSRTRLQINDAILAFLEESRKLVYNKELSV